MLRLDRRSKASLKIDGEKGVRAFRSDSNVCEVAPPEFAHNNFDPKMHCYKIR